MAEAKTFIVSGLLASLVLPGTYITGASRGLGLACLRILLDAPFAANVVALSRSTPPELEALAQKYPGSLIISQGDVSSDEANKEAVAVAMRAYGRLDGLILNAGTIEFGRVADVDVDALRNVWEVNLVSCFSILKHAIPELRRSNGRVVFVSSGAATGGTAAWSSYNTSKAAMNSLCRTVASEEPDITFVALRPGMVDTPMQEDLRSRGAEFMSKAERVHRGKRLPRNEPQKKAKRGKAGGVTFGKGKGRALQASEMEVEAKPDPMDDTSIRWSAAERKSQASAAAAAFITFFESSVCMSLLPTIVDLRGCAVSPSPASYRAYQEHLSDTTLASIVLPALQTVAASFYRISPSLNPLRLIAVGPILNSLGYWIDSSHTQCAEAAIRAVDSIAIGCDLVDSRPSSPHGQKGSPDGHQRTVINSAKAGLEGSRGSTRGRRWSTWQALHRRLEPINPKLQVAAASTIISLTTRGSVLDLPRPPHILAALLHLMTKDDLPVQAEAAFALAHLVSTSEEMQIAAHQFAMIPVLKVLLVHADTKIHPYPSPTLLARQSMLREGVLLALASLTSVHDGPRTSTIEEQILPYVVAGLSDRSAPVRAAACQCCRALSRAVSILRTSLLDAGAGARLFDLVVGVGDDGNGDADDDVRVTAMAAVCNLVLDFSPMKQELLDRGGVAKLVALSKESNFQLRLYALFGLKNMTFSASRELKIEVADAMGWDYIAQLLDDPELRIQEHAFSLLRNFAYGRVADIDLITAGLGEARLISILETRLQQHTSGYLTSIVTSSHDSTVSSIADRLAVVDRVTVHAVYVVVNIATGTERHKMLIANSTGLLRAIMGLLNDTDAEIRIGAVWCIFNLLHREGQRRSPASPALRALGVDARLRALRDDEVLDVRERARDALEHLEGKTLAD